jgi:hypothetical protein
MSLVAISGNASGTGTLTIAAPNTNSNFTLTLPTVTGTVLTNKTAGTVLQVVSATTTTSVARTTAGAVDTGLTATITPTSNTNKILVIAHQNGCRKQTADTYMEIKLLRDASSIATLAVAQGYTASTVTVQSGTVSIAYLDSPATTSATTYKTQLNNTTATGTVTVQVNSDVSTITLMEIAA